MRKFIIFVAAMLLAANTAYGITASDIRWGQDVTSNMASNTLKQWTISMQGQLGGSDTPGTGNTYYVDSGVTVEGDGSSWTKARNTLDEAIGLCTDNNGDVIYVAEGHAETWSTAALGVTCDVIGVKIIGKGEGSNRPTFTYTHADATIDVTVANVTIRNLRFVSGVSAVVSSITLAAGADYLTVSGCEWVTPASAAYEFYDMITLATGSDYVTIFGNKFVSLTSTTGCNQAINGDTGIVDRLVLVGNEFQGAFTVAAVHSSRVNTNMLVAGNVVHQASTGQFRLEFTAAATGILADNYVYTDAVATAIDPGSLSCFGNLIINTVDLSAYAFPPVPAIGTVTAGSAEDILKKLYYGSDGTGAYPATLANDSALAMVLAKGSTATASTYSNATDSLEMLSDKAGAFSGDGGAAQDDSTKASLDLLHKAALPTYNHPNYFAVDVNLANATWNTAAAHEIATVTGACRVQMLIEVTETCVTTGPTGTFALGFEGNATAIVAATGLDSGGTTFTAGDVVSAVYAAAATTPASGANSSNAITGALFDVVAVGGKDIGYTIGTNAATDGTLVIHVWWEPLDSTGAVVEGAGGAL